jgi:hypothetical protein
MTLKIKRPAKGFPSRKTITRKTSRVMYTHKPLNENVINEETEKFWEELITDFPFIQHRPQRK